MLLGWVHTGCAGRRGGDYQLLSDAFRPLDEAGAMLSALRVHVHVHALQGRRPGHSLRMGASPYPSFPVVFAHTPQGAIFCCS